MAPLVATAESEGGISTEVDQPIQILNTIVIVHCNKINIAQIKNKNKE
jgi:hypothetical protein